MSEVTPVVERPAYPAAGAGPRSAALRSLADEQLAPLAAINARLAGGWTLALDAHDARTRVASGHPAYDPHAVVSTAGSLAEPFLASLAALEHAGLVSGPAAARARPWALGAGSLVASWLAREPLPGNAVRAAALRAGALVGRSLLRRASAAAADAVTFDDWTRAHCPACGGPADFAFPAWGGRRLLCARCDLRWRAPGEGCLGCGAAEAPEIGHIPVDDLSCTLLVCHPCGRYLKELPAAPPDDPTVDRYLTESLDSAAECRGLRL